MTPKTEAALDASIKHWEENLEHAKAGVLDMIEIGSRQCALCNLFNNRSSQPCHGCPVYDKTGKTACEDTPYEDAWWAGEWENITAIVDACTREVEFLKSLKPNKDEPNA